MSFDKEQTMLLTGTNHMKPTQSKQPVLKFEPDKLAPRSNESTVVRSSSSMKTTKLSQGLRTRSFVNVSKK
jgi:hypothetical protein